jgi:hypothetical protein
MADHQDRQDRKTIKLGVNFVFSGEVPVTVDEVWDECISALYLVANALFAAGTPPTEVPPNVNVVVSTPRLTQVRSSKTARPMALGEEVPEPKIPARYAVELASVDPSIEAIDEAIGSLLTVRARLAIGRSRLSSSDRKGRATALTLVRELVPQLEPLTTALKQLPLPTRATPPRS